MNIYEAIKEMWESGEFSTHRKVKYINKILSTNYNINYSNTSSALVLCKYLRLDKKKGWIQRFGSSTQRVDSKFILKKFNIHPEILKVSEGLFLNKHYSQAIFEACKRLIKEVKIKSKRKDIDGTKLMTEVFKLDNGIIRFNSLLDQYERDEQQGYMYMFMGLTLAFRNPNGHENLQITNLDVALRHLDFISFLFFKLEESIFIST